MKKDVRKASQASRRRRGSGTVARIVKWSAGLAVVAAIIYGLSAFSGVPYDDEDIAVVNFSDLTPSEKRTALQAANRARCTCGCGMTLAQCVATDSTCPVRAPNIERIKTMVREADQS